MFRKKFAKKVASVIDTPEQAAITSSNLFSAELTRLLTCSMPGTFAYSPFLIRALLGMTKLGGVGPTADELTTGVKIPKPHMTYSKVFTGLMAALLENNETGAGNVFLAANRFHIKQGFPITGAFSKKLSEHYNESLAPIHFSDPALGATMINSWFEAAMHGHVRDVIQQRLLSHHTRIVLVSSVFFQGNWSFDVKFERKATRKVPFYVKPGKVVTVPMMIQKSLTFYAELKELEATMVAIPYWGDRLHLIIVLPRNKPDLARFRKSLPSEKLSRKFVITLLVDIHLPRFTIESAVHFIPALKQLGVRTMFDPTIADFSGITGHETTGLFVSEVIQKVRVEVAEDFNVAPIEPEKKKGKGGRSVSRGAKGKGKGIPFHVDHPFIFQIVDMETHAVLIAGTCTNPLKLCSSCV